MRLHMLGISGPYPASGGATSGYLLEAGGAALQFDFGAGVLSRLTAVYPPEDLDGLFLSHWHFDHTSDLLPLIYRLQSLQAVLPVYGPADPSSAIRRIVSEAGCFDLRELAPGDTVAVKGAVLHVGEARHPVPAVGFRVESEGKVFGYTGDTNTLPSLEEFYRGCDLLLADALFPAASWAPEKPHLSAPLAAELACGAGAGRLILTHLNPVFPPELLLREAQAVFPVVSLAAEGTAVQL